MLQDQVQANICKFIYYANVKKDFSNDFCHQNAAQRECLRKGEVMVTGDDPEELSQAFDLWPSNVVT